MLLGYARVSTAEQNPNQQTDALTRADVAAGDVYLDEVSGTKASRPQLDALLRDLHAFIGHRCITTPQLGNPWAQADQRGCHPAR